MSDPRSIFTRAVHAGERRPRPDYTPVSTPIHPAVAYTYDDMAALDAVFEDEDAGPVYRRYGNPTVEAFERAVAAVEEGEAAYATASGMAAVHGALLAAGARQGSLVVASQDCYGATYHLLSDLLSRLGIEHAFADFTDLDGLRELVGAEKPDIVLCETVSNPLMRVADVEAVAGITRETGAALVVDSTFSTPYLCRPLALGADYVVHSATKYIGGHDDVLGGLVVTSRENRHALYEIEKDVGGNLGPFDAWLGLRGLKTLPLRMERHCRNGLEVARWLEEHPAVEGVNYPGLESHPQHEVARRLHRDRGFGGMLSFDIRGAGRGEVFDFMERLELVQAATTLGDVYSLVLYPAMSSHRALPAEERRRLGIGDGLVRLSVGIEEAADVIGDLDRALA